MDTESGQDATKTEQATLVDAETQTQEFDNKVIKQDATETEQATMLDEETQTEEFDYLFQRPDRYSPPDIDFFDTDDKIRFYTGLPTKEILITTFQHVASHVPQRSTTLNNFQEFVLVLMKLRLNMPFQELAFRFGVCYVYGCFYHIYLFVSLCKLGCILHEAGIKSMASSYVSRCVNRTWCQKWMLILPRAIYAQQEKSSLQSVKAVPGIADQFSSEFKRLRASQAV